MAKSLSPIGKDTCPQCRKEDSKDNKRITRIELSGSPHRRFLCPDCGRIPRVVVEVR